MFIVSGEQMHFYDAVKKKLFTTPDLKRYLTLNHTSLTFK